MKQTSNFERSSLRSNLFHNQATTLLIVLINYIWFSLKFIYKVEIAYTVLVLDSLLFCFQINNDLVELQLFLI